MPANDSTRLSALLHSIPVRTPVISLLPAGCPPSFDCRCDNCESTMARRQCTTSIALNPLNRKLPLPLSHDRQPSSASLLCSRTYTRERERTKEFSPENFHKGTSTCELLQENFFCRRTSVTEVGQRMRSNYSSICCRV